MVEIPFTLGDAPARAERDGCGCPQWVERCVHFGNDGVVLAGLHNTRHDKHSRGNRYAVYSMAMWEPCHWCGDLCTYSLPFYVGDDHDAALATFHEAEKRLLRGEAGS